MKYEREVQPINVWYGKTEFHHQEQWFLKGNDIEKNEERDFALKDIERFV